MNARLRLAMTLIVWGLAHRAENNVIEVCLFVLVLGMTALAAVAASSAALGVACVVALIIATWSLYLHGETKGPPDGFSE